MDPNREDLSWAWLTVSQQDYISGAMKANRVAVAFDACSQRRYSSPLEGFCELKQHPRTEPTNQNYPVQKHVSSIAQAMPARVTEGLWSPIQDWIQITYAGYGPAEYASPDAGV